MNRKETKAMPLMMPRKLANARAALAALVALSALSGCISIGSKPPPSVMTLTPLVSLPDGTSLATETAMVVREPSAPAELAVNRVPVQINASEIAYLKDAQWVDKPSRLFANLLAETISARQQIMVLPRADRKYATKATIAGRLSKFGYDVPSGSVVVRYDAVLENSKGESVSRRFEANVTGVPAEAAPVAEALNTAANEVAVEVSDWAASQS